MLPVPFNPGFYPIFVVSCLFALFFDCEILHNVACLSLFLLLPTTVRIPGVEHLDIFDCSGHPVGEAL